VGARRWADRRSAHPSIRDWRSKDAKPGRKSAPREREGLFVWGALQLAMFVLILRSADAEDVSQTRTCVRASRRVRTATPSCFETHRSARGLRKHLRSRRAATLLSMRAGARRILAKRTQRVPLGSSPRKRGPITTVFGYGSRLSARFAGVGRDDDGLVRAKHQPAGVRNHPGAIPLFPDCYLQ
jgi:hypothetical protein